MIKRNKKGQFVKGTKLPKVIKEKMSKSHKGKKFTEEHRKKIGEANKGRIVSVETRKKISEATKGPRLHIRGKNSSNWKGGKYKSSDGYVLIYKPNHPFCPPCSYMCNSRLVAEKCLGRYLTKKEIVHHINGKKDDDRPENLFLFFSIAKHIIFHQLKNKPILISNLI